ncbi:hypothetical protein Tco_0941684 [Tanacetum coccineum]|uniref:Uncharacterized protein n=1 Tax=Tanacetum coccineum TaxID=301880 RepID=A0ABQ5DXK1_9ASTR
MMTYLKHVGGKKHADLKKKNFEEIQVLYKEVKRSDKNFMAIGSTEDEKQIKEMNEEAKDPKKKISKKTVIKETSKEEDTTMVPAEQEVIEHGINTIPEKESNEFIKLSVEDLVPIPSEFEDTSESDSDCDLPLCDDFSPINISKEKSVTFSNPLFDSNDDFTSSDDESLSDEDVLEENVKTYLNPLFKFDGEYISSAVNPHFDEVLENIESKDSYVSNFDESGLLVTPLSDADEDECFDP